MKKTDSTVASSWRYIENWLNTEAKAINSDILAHGASDKTIRQFEKALNLQCSSDFKSSYLIHNGSTEKVGLFHAGDLLSLKEISDKYFELLNKISGWSDSWLPFIECNEEDYIYIKNQSGEVYTITLHDYRITDNYRIAFSIEVFLANFVKDLKKGNGIMGEMLCEI